MNPPPSRQALLHDLDYFLFDLRAGINAQPDLLFAKVRAETYYQSAFLDHRITPRPQEFFRLPLARAVLDAPREAPDLYIAHTSFCCSTLLARCLQAAQLLSLREPRVLGVLANEYRRLQRPTAVDELGRCVFRLLGKRESDKQSVIVKGTNYTNNLLVPWLRMWPQRRVLLMWGTLEDFLISMCKHETEAGRNLWPFLQAFLIDAGIDSGQHASWQSLPLLQQAVWVWHLQIKYFIALLQRHPAANVKTLAAADFLAAPLATTMTIHAWLGCAVDDGARRRQVDETMGRDAKETVSVPAATANGQENEALIRPGESHARGRATVRQRNSAAIEEALQWARNEDLLPDLSLLHHHQMIHS